MIEPQVVDVDTQAALDTTNEDYDIWLPRWEKAQDVKEGEDYVKDKGEGYLPKTSLMALLKNGDDLYEAYKERASFFNGTGRTVDGLLGLVFRKAPVFTYPDTIKEWESNIDLHNSSLLAFSKKVLEQIILKNRVGILVDYPVKNEVLSAAAAENLNLRPFATLYSAEHIMDWDEERINNVYKTSFVMLSELERQRTDLVVAEVEKRRVLDLAQEQDEEGNFSGARFYRQRVYEKQTLMATVDGREVTSEKWVLIAEFFPTDINGQKFMDIPFFAVTDRGISWNLESSMVYDLVNVNIALYRNSADYENILHVGTNPTPCAVGLKSRTLSNPNIDEKPESTDEQVALGLNTLLEFEEGGTAWMLEASGQGATSMATTMADKKNEMALLGGRILASDPSGVESAETAQIHRDGEQSVLASAVDSLNEVIQKMLIVMNKWQTGTELTSEEVSISFNKDYLPGKLEAAIVATAFQGLQNGAMSFEEVFEMLQKGEWINAEKSYEDHAAEVLTTMEQFKTQQEPFVL